jgi:hypothetical protein
VAREEGAPNPTEFPVLAVAVKNATLDVPPPGTGLTTVTQPVFAVAMSAAGTIAVNWEPLTN